MGWNIVSFGKAFEDWIRTYLAGPAYRKTFANLALDGNEQVLELGCGGGQTARVLLRRLDRGHLTGIDVDEWWADRASRNLRRYDNVEILLGDVRDLPLEEGGFDLAVVHLVIHDIEKAERGPIIEALAGKLRDGGRLFIKEPTKEPHGMPEAEIWELLTGAGLQETARAASRSMFMGPIVEGQFEK